MKNGEDGYKLKLVGVGITIEQSISKMVARQIIALVMGGGSDSDESVRRHTTVSAPASGRSIGDTPMEFMTSRRATTDMERVTCLAYYLKHKRDTPVFKTKELTELNIEAAQPKLSNPSATSRNAVTHGYLSLAGGGQKQITARGEALVTALPDREKVQESLNAIPFRKLRKRRERRAK